MQHLSLLVLLVCATSFSWRGDAALAPALFVLGDSTMDTGNQNYITSVVKSNYPPYGKDKLANDFIGTLLMNVRPLHAW